MLRYNSEHPRRKRKSVKLSTKGSIPQLQRTYRPYLRWSEAAVAVYCESCRMHRNGNKAPRDAIKQTPESTRNDVAQARTLERCSCGWPAIAERLGTAKYIGMLALPMVRVVWG